MKNYLHVYVAQISGDTSKQLNCEQRRREVEEAGVQKKQKYFVWRLLEYAAEDISGFIPENFTKDENGKWRCPQFEFSLSHSKNAVCVAVSDLPVGVDIEYARNLKEGLERFLTDAESAEYMRANDKNAYLLEKWTQKESLFKKNGGKVFRPSQLSTGCAPVKTVRVTLPDGNYVVSVASEKTLIENFKIQTVILK